MYSRILFPTDFGEYSRQALQCILEFRHVGLKEVILLHVIDMDELGWYASIDILQLRERQSREIASIRFKELETQVREHGLKPTSLVELGIPSVEILRIASEMRVSLIVGGSHRKRKEQEDPLDTTTARIVRNSAIPVLVTRYHSSWENPEQCMQVCKNQFSKLLVPVDWSECSLKAVDYVVGLKSSEPQEVIVAHVMDEHALQYTEAEKIEEFRKKDLERLEHTRLKLSLAGFQAKTHLHFGTPHKEIARIAREAQATLVVMGHHGKGWLKNLLIGSTTERVLRQTKTPVLVVNDIER